MCADEAQQRALTALQSLFDALQKPTRAQTLRRRRPWLGELGRHAALPFLDRLGAPPNGVYLWGAVGRGKTMLMDLFFDALPFADKTRMHFHAFMQSVHNDLARLDKQTNPLRRLARDLARRNRVLCLDEFIVTNITDAMLLSGLLQALHDFGLPLVATSNRQPDDLYPNGLQRERFLPAIAHLKRHNRVIHLDGPADHRQRLRPDTALHAFVHPPDAANRRLFKAQFERLSTLPWPPPETPPASITLRGRPVPALAVGGKMAAFRFEALCSAPRAAIDYVELAQRMDAVFISDVPRLDSRRDDQARRFIYLVDALYSQHRALFLLAETAPEQLYQGAMLEFAFRRTASRLTEMRSTRYLQQTPGLSLHVS